MALFKYLSPEKGLRVLAECELMVTPPKYLNDPFEASPVIKSEDAETYARRRIDELGTRESFETNRALYFPMVGTFEEFQSLWQIISAQLLEKMVAETPTVNSQFQSLVPEIISERFGVICFAPDAVDQTMWAKYSPSHDGLVIEFRQSHQLFSGPSFFEIHYSDEPLVFDPSSSTVTDDAELLLSRKRLRWSSERESRLLVKLAGATARDLPEGRRYFIPIEPEIIVSVTLGLRATDQIQGRVIELLHAPHFENVGLFKIRKNTGAGTFERERLQALRNS
jgi:hypothetical protein